MNYFNLVQFSGFRRWLIVYYIILKILIIDDMGIKNRFSLFD